MKQVYYSEKLNKMFDTEEACRAAEDRQEDIKVEKSHKNWMGLKSCKQDCKKNETTSNCSSNKCTNNLSNTTKEKKELANAVELAEKNLQEACQNYELKKEEAKKLRKECEQKIVDLLEPARKAIDDANLAKYEAIKNYNAKYGTYTVTYSGDKAFEEYRRLTHDIFDAARLFWDWF